MESSETEAHKVGYDIEAIPPTMQWWEYVILIPYLVFAGLLVWYVSENMLVWEPESPVWGLPKPVAGALALAVTWIVVNFLVAGYYLMMIRRRLRALGRGD